MKSEYSNFLPHESLAHLSKPGPINKNKLYFYPKKDYKWSCASASASHTIYVTGVWLGNNNACQRCLHWQCVDAVITINMSLK